MPPIGKSFAFLAPTHLGVNWGMAIAADIESDCPNGEWSGRAYGLTRHQFRRYLEIKDRSRGLAGPGLLTKQPHVMLAHLCDLGLDPLDDDDCAIWYALVGYQWPMFDVSDQPEVRSLLKPRRDWSRFIHHFSTRADRQRLAQLPDTVTVYRGVHDRRRLCGWSYTMNRAVAVNFATTLGKIYADAAPSDRVSLVLTGVVARSSVLAAFNDREEAELVIDPRSVQPSDLVQLYDLERHASMAVTAYKQRPYSLDRRRWRRK